MNTTHKWNSFNDYNYRYYPQNYGPAKKDENSPEETVKIAEELNTNFLNLPKDFKIS